MNEQERKQGVWGSQRIGQKDEQTGEEARRTEHGGRRAGVTEAGQAYIVQGQGQGPNLNETV